MSVFKQAAVFLLCFSISLPLCARTNNSVFASISQVDNPSLDAILAEQAVAVPLNQIDYLIASFLSRNQKCFEEGDLMILGQQLQNMSPAQLLAVTSKEYKNPTLALVLSVFFGHFGVDRFYVGDIGLGIVKLLSLGGFGIWWIIDLFVIQHH